MAWPYQATSHYLNQCWQSSMSPYDVTRPHRVNITYCVMMTSSGYRSDHQLIKYTPYLMVTIDNGTSLEYFGVFVRPHCNNMHRTINVNTLTGEIRLENYQDNLFNAKMIQGTDPEYSIWSALSGNSRLLHSPGTMAVGLLVEYETWPPTGWHHLCDWLV